MAVIWPRPVVPRGGVPFLIFRLAFLGFRGKHFARCQVHKLAVNPLGPALIFAFGFHDVLIGRISPRFFPGPTLLTASPQLRSRNQRGRRTRRAPGLAGIDANNFRFHSGCLWRLSYTLGSFASGSTGLVNPARNSTPEGVNCQPDDFLPSRCNSA